MRPNGSKQLIDAVGHARIMVAQLTGLVAWNVLQLSWLARA